MHPAVPDLSVAVEELVRFFRRLSPDTGLSLTAAATLSSLDRGGPARLTELAVQQGVTQPAMTQLVTRLQDAGLAERRPDADDGRVVLVHLTAAGRTELTRRRAIRTERLGELFDRLPDDQQAALVTALPAIHALIQPAEQVDDRPRAEGAHL
ncbi:MarR family winged helix-turn-helix transcriptional regulator [Actinophytocola oryzae]|uniref:DNA-binding MarR family transcriptional regulator n=1 Tax=Actinophytocola oryzae TaxID=502181 RepID=A0A4R7V5T7_9PSEU|nr:MarR family transcriptional regulator [Actinophytocola oryzae]TDV44833.1 DNA-binding MarR family transcriptional regulator [Actinophytocola oryzae]